MHDNGYLKTACDLTREKLDLLRRILWRQPNATCLVPVIVRHLLKPRVGRSSCTIARRRSCSLEGKLCHWPSAYRATAWIIPDRSEPSAAARRCGGSSWLRGSKLVHGATRSDLLRRILRWVEEMKAALRHVTGCQEQPTKLDQHGVREPDWAHWHSANVDSEAMAGAEHLVDRFSLPLSAPRGMDRSIG